MTVDEFLTQNKSILKVMVKNGIPLNYAVYAGIVEMYEKAKSEQGSKYAVELCKTHYPINTRRRLYQILEVLKRDLP